jgi:hypothetical protein
MSIVRASDRRLLAIRMHADESIENSLNIHSADKNARSVPANNNKAPVVRVMCYKQLHFPYANALCS